MGKSPLGLFGLKDAIFVPQGSHRPGKVLEFDQGPGKLLEFENSAICPGIVLEFVKLPLKM